MRASSRKVVESEVARQVEDRPKGNASVKSRIAANLAKQPGRRDSLNNLLVWICQHPPADTCKPAQRLEVEVLCNLHQYFARDCSEDAIVCLLSLLVQQATADMSQVQGEGARVQAGHHGEVVLAH